ncbi:uncharacterized protein MELLADRAFT_93079 [Melampsora larici-populina 98AG31]|uniref:Uncharacterized protein n=1 Tax=Melampsora larici-populina (strain 98AG31 / pathotype 3-4-7) TaxID=747676 RepID=F4S3V5_MELLP|nr:uncharacterized protein MELLADRAFT_93079 [Melampsora larici-populina 98AG31]EGG00676.1 hypothetical protein MELLADRAFT_93079 [Melampsora larici-populina 98AG31]
MSKQVYFSTGHVDHSPTPSLEDPRSHAQFYQSQERFFPGPKNEVVESPMGHYDVDTNLADENDRRDTLLELFEDVEQLVASPQTLNNAAPAQSELELSASYDPLLVTPGAPSLPSARHKIAKLPYHLSTDHHSAILSLSNPLTSFEAITEDGNHTSLLVPPKRPHPSSHQESTQPKRSRRPPHDSSSPKPFQPMDVPFQPTEVPFEPQKRPHISNHPEESNAKRSCIRSNDQNIAQTSANDSMPPPHDNATHQDPRVGVDASTKELQHLPQTHTQTNRTPITQLADSLSQNHDKTNNLTSPESREPRSNNDPSHLIPNEGLPINLPLQYVRRTPTQSRTHSRESATTSTGGSPLNPDHVPSSASNCKSPNSTSDLRLPVSHIQRSPSASTLYNPSLSQSLKRFQTHQQPANRRDPGYEEPQIPSSYPTYTHAQISPKSHPETSQESIRGESQHPPSAGHQRLTRSLNLPTSSSQHTSKSNDTPRARSQEASRQRSRNQNHADALDSTSPNRPSSLSPDVTFRSAPANTKNLPKAFLLPSPEVSRRNNKSPFLDRGYVETSSSPIHNPYNISNPPYEGPCRDAGTPPIF